MYDNPDTTKLIISLIEEHEKKSVDLYNTCFKYAKKVVEKLPGKIADCKTYLTIPYDGGAFNQSHTNLFSQVYDVHIDNNDNLIISTEDGDFNAEYMICKSVFADIARWLLTTPTEELIPQGS